MARDREHLFIPINRKERADYIYPLPVGGGGNNHYPIRQNRIAHARSVLQKLNLVERELKNLEDDAQTTEGYYIEFEGEAPNENGTEFFLKVESFEPSPSYQLVSYSKGADGIERAVIFVAEGKLDVLKRKIQSTFDENATRNIYLVNSIADIKIALLRSLWTSDPSLYPNDTNAEFVWEVWMFDEEAAERKFISFCDQRNIRRIGTPLRFIDRIVMQVSCSANTLSQIMQYSKILCELRKPSDTAMPIYESDIESQYQWAESLRENTHSHESSSEVWILDSGLNRRNPLLEHLIPDNRVQSVNGDWASSDDLRWEYHGTRMAGVVQYGDLLKKLLETNPITLLHTVGSIKILPPYGHNDPTNYPSITNQAISLTQMESPHKRKIYCLAVTDPNICKLGESTTWSAEIDNLSYSSDDHDDKKLFIISAGNHVSDRFPFGYPEENELSPIQDPAQSWNSLTVGAYTNRDVIEEGYLRGGFTPVAPLGRLAPRSTTSLTWSSLSHVPIKPDIVLEGGNIARSITGNEWDTPASLSELTTSGRADRVFDYFHSTSSATAYASYMAATIQAQNDQLWPETIRALIVHSAEWTDQMIAEFHPFRNKTFVHSMLRKYGYGVPQLDKALANANNEVTLISQSELKPFKQGASNNITYDDCHIYSLPWPVEILRQLGDAQVKMKVTLSYFIEPNPSRRGDIKKYLYSSFGLRFIMIGPTESEAAFKGRVSAIFQEDNVQRTPEDNQNWFLGPDLRTRGSIHSDIWNGKAAELAGKHKIAVYPVGGWWKDYKKQSRWMNRLRYSLIISIEGPETSTEIYNSVQNLIPVPVEVAIT